MAQIVKPLFPASEHAMRIPFFTLYILSAVLSAAFLVVLASPYIRRHGTMKSVSQSSLSVVFDATRGR
jgi:hypothetical protein